MESSGILMLICKLSNGLRRENAVSSSGVNSGRRVLSFLLSSEGDVYQKDIEKALFLRPSSATTALKTLETDGLIFRVPSKDDERFKRIVLTDKAFALKSQLEDELSGIEKYLTRGIGEDDIEIFRAVCLKMLENIGSMA